MSEIDVLGATASSATRERSEAWTGTRIAEAPVFFSSYPAPVNTRPVHEAGFSIERDELVTFREPEGQATFQWILARS